MDKNQLYRRIPKVDVLLEEDGIRKLEERYGRSCVKRVVQDELERVLFYTRIWGEHHLIENMQKNWL